MKAIFAFLFCIQINTIIPSDTPPKINSDHVSAIHHGFEQFLDKLDSCDCKPLSGGLSSNVQYQCIANKKKYVARILKESLQQRQSEIAIHQKAAEHAIAPKIHYQVSSDQSSLIIMDFIDDHTLFVDQANKPEVLDQIAQQLRTLAQFDPKNLSSKKPKDMVSKIAKSYQKLKAQSLEILDPMLDLAMQKIEPIHQRLNRNARPLVLSHNDLNPRNIFFTEDKIMIIDWEAARINHDFYDIASYSVFLCLDPADDAYLLTQYLQRIPSDTEMQQFKDFKLVTRVFDAFGLLAFLQEIPQSISTESIQSFKHYETIFAQDAQANSTEFLYALAVSQLKEFFKEFEQVSI